MYSTAATAARFVAPLQSRSSNIRVTPLDAPAVDPGRHLVVYRARPSRELLGPDAHAILLSQEHHLVPQLHFTVNPEDAGVHRNSSQDRAPHTPDKRRRSVRESAAISLGVPDRHRSCERRCLGSERQAVGDALTRREMSYICDIALQDKRGSQPFLCRIFPVTCRMQTVERYTRAYTVVVGGGVPEEAC